MVNPLMPGHKCEKAACDSMATTYRPGIFDDLGIGAWLCDACYESYIAVHPRRLNARPQHAVVDRDSEHYRSTRFKKITPQTTAPTRECVKCHRIYPETAEFFNKHARGRGGLRTACRECQAVYNKTLRGK